jgi:hypothetical protein
VKSLGGLTKLSAWWVSLGIDVVRSRPGCPQDNGGHERMHADIRAEVQSRAARTVAEQQAVCDAWRLEFNHVRPHEALGMRTPAELYRASPRRPSHVVAGGAPDGAAPAIVNRQGNAYYLGRRIYVSLALPGYEVAFEPLAGVVRVWFRHRLIGAIEASAFDSEEVISTQPIREDGTPARREQSAMRAWRNDEELLPASARAQSVVSPGYGRSRRGNPDWKRKAEERRQQTKESAVTTAGVTCNPLGGELAGVASLERTQLEPPISQEVIAEKAEQTSEAR